MSEDDRRVARRSNRECREIANATKKFYGFQKRWPVYITTVLRSGKIPTLRGERKLIYEVVDDPVLADKDGRTEFTNNVVKITAKRSVDLQAGYGDIHEGAIYYRYTGQTRTISFTDLQTMLTDREDQYLRKMMETLQVIQKVGLDNVGVVDLSAQKSRIYMSKETARGLTLIDKGQIVQERGSPAYVVMGNVDLEQVVRAPLDEADKNLPSEAAKILLPLVQKIYGDLTGISPSQVTQLLKYLGIDGDSHHCVFERKFRRKFVTRAGIDAIANFIRKQPTEALRAFGSRLANSKFDLKNAVTSPNEMLV